MTIGFDVSDLVTGRADGTTRYTRELATRMPMLAPNESWTYFAPGRDPEQSRFPRNVTWRTSWSPKYWTQARLPFELYRYPVDIVFMPIQQLPILRPTVKTVAVVHDLAFHYYPEQYAYKDWALLHLFTAHVTRAADHLIAVSHSTARDIAHEYGRSKNVLVIPHGVDRAYFHTPTPEQRIGSWNALAQQYPELKPSYLLFVGQIQPRKNLVRLIEAFEQLQGKNPGLQLVIAGSHGWLQRPILERVHKSSISNQILMLGRVPERLLPALYWHASVFVLPSLYEGFGIPVLEAMACGCPVVTSTTSSLPEVAGDAAVLVDPLDASAIAHGIQRALNNSDALREKSLTQAQQFTWEKTAQATVDALTKYV